MIIKWLQQAVRMSKQTRRSNSGVREVLKEIVNNDHNLSTTHRKNSSLQSIKLNEAMSFLQRKIQRQYSEIQMLSEQLSREISMKEELAVLLRDERDKLGKASLHLANANKANVELKKKLAKIEKEFGEGDTMRTEYQIKLNKYRDIVRKKDELLTKNQQKLEEFLKNERQAIDKDHELRSLKDTVLKLREKEGSTAAEIQALKKKNGQLQQQIEQQSKEIFQFKQQLMFANEKNNRMQLEMADLNEQLLKKQVDSRAIIQKLTYKIEQQHIQLRELQNKPKIDRPEWDLNVYKNEIRRMIGSCVKDNNLRKKLEKEMMEVMGEVERGFHATMDQLITALQP